MEIVLPSARRGNGIPFAILNFMTAKPSLPQSVFRERPNPKIRFAIFRTWHSRYSFRSASGEEGHALILSHNGALEAESIREVEPNPNRQDRAETGPEHCRPMGQSSSYRIDGNGHAGIADDRQVPGVPRVCEIRRYQKQRSCDEIYGKEGADPFGKEIPKG